MGSVASTGGIGGEEVRDLIVAGVEYRFGRIKRDDARVERLSDARAILAAPPRWFAHHNEIHPHRTPGYHSNRAFIAVQEPW